MRTVSFKTVENNDGSIALHDLYKEDFTSFHTPFLEFKSVKDDESCWDNDQYLLKFFRGIKKNKKTTVKELKDFCKKYDLDYQITLEDLLDIYKSSKKLNFWKL